MTSVVTQALAHMLAMRGCHISALLPLLQSHSRLHLESQNVIPSELRSLEENRLIECLSMSALLRWQHSEYDII